MPLPRTLTLVLIVVTCVYTTEGFINVVLPPFLEQQGVPLAQLGGIIAAMNVAALLSRLPAGLLYRPERASLYAALALAAVAGATFAYPRTDSEAVLGALRLVHGFAFGVATTLNMAQFFDARPRGFESGRAMGLFAAALAAGFVIGGFLGGWWADTFGFEAAFSAAALFPLTGAILNLGVRPERRHVEAAVAGGPRPSMCRAGLAAARNPAILLAALLLFSTNLLNQAFGPFFNLYALGVGMTLTLLGTIMGVSSIAAMFTRLIAGELGRWWSYQTICRGAITLSAVAVMLVPATTAHWALGAILLVVYVLRAVLTVTGGASVIAATDATAEQRGMASSLFNMGKDLGSILGPLLGGVAAAQVGVALALPLMAVATLLLFWGGTAALEARLRQARPAAPAPVTPRGSA